jgi:hypothetical protein
MDHEVPLPQTDKTPEKAYFFADGMTVHSAGDWHEIRVATVATEDAGGCSFHGGVYGAFCSAVFA